MSVHLDLLMISHEYCADEVLQQSRKLTSLTSKSTKMPPIHRVRLHRNRQQRIRRSALSLSRSVRPVVFGCTRLVKIPTRLFRLEKHGTSTISTVYNLSQTPGLSTQKSTKTNNVPVQLASLSRLPSLTTGKLTRQRKKTSSSSV